MGGKGGLNIWDLEEDEKGAFFFLCSNIFFGYIVFVGVPSTSERESVRELDSGKQNEAAAAAKREEEERYYEEEDGPWYFGKAKEEFRKRKSGQAPPVRQGEEDPIQVSYSPQFCDVD